MLLFVFLDEAGNFRGNKDRYFVLAAFVTGNPRATRKCFLKAKRTKLPRKYRHYTELKFSDRVIPARFKKHVLRQLAKEDIWIYALLFDKNNMPAELLGHSEGLTYCRLVGQLLELCPLAEASAIHVFLDRRHLKGLSRHEFNANLKAHLAFRLGPQVRLEIQHVDSTTNVNIQLADFVCGAIFRKYERGDTEYYDIIAERIKIEEELFK